MDIPLQPAYVLHRRNYLENSLLLDLFTLDSGRVSCVARGALSSRRGRGALLQALQPLQVSLTGKGGLLTLKQVDAASHAILLQGKALFCTYYINELLLYLLPEREPAPNLFAYYAQALSGLASGALETTLRRFEVQVLDELGLAPDFLYDHQGHPVEDDARYRYEPDGYFILADQDSGAYSGATLRGLSLMDGAAESAHAHPECRREAKALMRKLLDQALQGRPLNSRKFFEVSAADASQTSNKEKNDG